MGRSPANCARSWKRQVYYHMIWGLTWPSDSLNGMPIPVVEKTKFLGMIFDRKLSFIPHLYYLKEKCLKAINLLLVVAHTSWGADQQTLLHLYRFLIRSKLDYGCCYDSLSSLQAIKSCKVKNSLILKILKDHSQLINSGKSITFCWIPSHVGIRGNEDADIAAKTGLDVTTTNMRFPVSDLLTCVNQ